MVEFAIFVPVLLLILLAAVDLGRVYLGWVSLNNIARIGANFAAQNPDAWQGGGDATVQLRFRQLMARDAAGINCTLPNPLPQPTFVDESYSVGARVRVDLGCSFTLVTPFIGNVIGDGAGHLNLSSSATFTIRFGSPNAAPIGGNASPPTPTQALTAAPSQAPTVAPSQSPTPTPAASSGPTPTPGPSPTATPQPVVVAFYGSPTSVDGSGGGPPGSTDENLIVGIPTLAVTFHNTTTGTQGNCNWVFGDGGTANACSETVSHSYLNWGTYTVSLTVDGYPVTRSSYVLVGCKVPAFAGVRRNSASATWTAAGFAWAHLTTLSGSGNYKIGFQSVVGGLVNPIGGCSGALIQVGP